MKKFNQANEKIITRIVGFVVVSIVLVFIGVQLAKAGERKLHATQSYAVGTPFNVGRISQFDMRDGNICYIFVSGDRSGMSCLEPRPLINSNGSIYETPWEKMNQSEEASD